MNILVINGPNINFIGVREPHIYGDKSYSDLLDYLQKEAQRSGHLLEIYQSNHEGALIDYLQAHYTRFEGIIINPGALTHYSYSLYDCLKSLSLPVVEVHLSDIHSRESFRKRSVIKPACIAQISGKGFAGYKEALVLLAKGVQPR
ncbi:MAG: 3-dehydroquinate dehydratase [Candidatus Izemoplasmatales bacterium]|nr:3-dehydroquinate dehydratase [Candidatus Izemoplasmatales bacterium]